MPPNELLRIDAQGFAVNELQRFLVRREYPVVVDGIFGQGTDEVVQQFKQARGLKPDGIVGPTTWAMLQDGER